MKKGSFKGLLFREFYIARKNYGYNLFAYFLMVVVGLLALLSYKYGNLHKYWHLMDDMQKSTVDMMLKYMPAFVGTCFFGGVSDATPNDEKMIWRRFRTACAVTPFRFALAKYVCSFLALLISFAMTFGWLGLHSLLTGTALTQTDFSITMALYTAGVLLIIYMQNICIWVGTLERALIICMISISAIIVPITFKNPDFMTDDGWNRLKEFCITLTPFTLLIIPLTFLLGILCTTILYGRREK